MTENGVNDKITPYILPFFVGCRGRGPLLPQRVLLLLNSHNLPPPTPTRLTPNLHGLEDSPHLRYLVTIK